MSYVVTHRMGWDERDPPLSTLHELLDELSEHEDDIEHGSVAISHEGGAALEVYRDGGVVFTADLEAKVVEQFHIPLGTLDRQALIEAMSNLAEGRLDEVRALPWRPGNQ
jgi:pyruvate formate-lyase activating enzyme-like uncharacterized protein